MPIPGRISSLLPLSHYAVEATICPKNPQPDFTRQGKVFLESEPLPRYYSKNRVASAQLLSCVTITRPPPPRCYLSPFFHRVCEKLRLEGIFQSKLNLPVVDRGGGDLSEVARPERST